MAQMITESSPSCLPVMISTVAFFLIFSRPQQQIQFVQVPGIDPRAPRAWPDPANYNDGVVLPAPILIHRNENIKSQILADTPDVVIYNGNGRSIA